MERDWKKMLHLAEALVKATVPEVSGTPLYFVPQAGTPFADSSARAWTSPRADLMVKAYLGERWRGRGVAVVINTGLLEKENPDWNLATAVYALVIHETGHAVADDWGLTQRAEPDDFPPERVAGLTALVSEYAATPSWADDNGVTPAEFYGHDAQWLRTCCHLCFRASAFGLYLPIAVIVSHRPELSRPESYLSTLGDEPARMRCRSFAEILAKPLPPRFAQLWAEDCKDFESARHVAGPEVLFSEKEKPTMSVLEKLLGRIVGRKLAKQKTALEQYRAIVAVLADDEEPREDEIESVLDAVGKTVEQLKGDVALLQKRRQLRVILDRAVGVAGERAKLDQKHAALTATFEAAERAFHEAVVPIQARNLELDSIERQATEAHGELSRTCDDETIPPGFEALGLERAELNRRRQALEASRKEFKRQISSVEVLAYNHTKGKPEEVLEAQRTAAPASREALAKVEADLSALDTEVRELGRRENVLQEKMVMV